MRHLAPDVYTVEWAVASTDGHAVSGSYAFEVTAPPAAPAARAPLIWLVVIALLVVLVLGGGVWRLARRRNGRGATGTNQPPGEAA